MALFGRRKAEVKKDLEEIKGLVETPLPTREALEGEVGSEGEVEEVAKPERKPIGAPLFVKLERYHNILSALSDIKNGLQSIKNIFSYVSELEKLKSESFKMLHDMVAKLDEKLSYLDSELLKPPGFETRFKPAPRFEPRIRQPMAAKPALEEAGLEEMITSMRSKLEEIRSQIEGV